MYRQLDDDRIIETLQRLRDRITERFPGSSLSRVGDELLTVARESASHIAYLAQPSWWVRTSVGLAIFVMMAGLVAATSRMRLDAGGMTWAELVQGVEAVINDVVFLGIAIFFLLTIETRLKRRRALAALHQLRSIAHVVDMHQLTKDPEQLLSNPPSTASSPSRTMSRAELGRYLDYCSEMLSLIGKIAALYAQYFDDRVVLEAVDEVEDLSTSLARKIWQKIMILNEAAARQTKAN